ncbi:MAG: glycoside hydrolase family 2 TIM barrel-domain containing protein [Oliverpabstia sp.]
MRRQDFNEDWIFYTEGSDRKERVTLPHDAMLHTGRSETSPGKDANGFYLGGIYIYEKELFAPVEWKDQTVRIEFGGVYRNTTVFVNGKKVGFRPYGYVPFVVCLDEMLVYGEKNKIRVVADNSRLPNSRWYTGGGIYRPVSLIVGNRAHIAWEGVKVSTLSYHPAVIRVETELEYSQIEPREKEQEVTVEILEEGRVIAQTVGNDVEIPIHDAKLWSDKTPYLYQVKVSLKENGKTLDEVVEQFGIRKVEWSPKGLFINGQETLLRGGCVHHDNGILGACSYAKAEERKVRILKENGFNALRISHNPASRYLLEACDKYGMYVMDETFDMWYQCKNKFDYASDFKKWYLTDIQSMIDQDFNHPSVIMYSIGNEVSEPVKPEGMKYAKEMIEFIHQRDKNRAVTAGINLMILLMSSKGKGIYDEGGMAKNHAEQDNKKEKKSAAKENVSGSLLFNTMMSVMGKGLNRMANSKKADQVTSPILDTLDIAGYNYASGRYPLEAKAHPERIVVGTETFPQDIADNWAMVKKLPYLIGDFMWTGWDYLGEAAIGSWNYEGASMQKVPYKWLLSGAGVIDILGRAGAQAKYAACIWEQLDEPYIGVRPLNHPGVRVTKSAWRGTDAFDSWAWNGCEGNKTIVEVYANADIAELRLNGKKLARKKLKKSKALFKVKYEPGILETITYDTSGNEMGRQKLQSAEGTISLVAEPEEKEIMAGEIGYIDVKMIGENGVIESNSDAHLTISVINGELLGFGSAKPNPEEDYPTNRCKSYYGHAQAVVRGNKAGVMKIVVEDEKGRKTETKVVVR